MNTTWWTLDPEDMGKHNVQSTEKGFIKNGTGRGTGRLKAQKMDKDID